MSRTLVFLYRVIGRERRRYRSWLYRRVLGLRASGFRSGRRLRLKADHLRIGANVSLGDNVRIRCHRLTIEDGASIGNNVTIDGIGDVYIGAYAMIGDEVYIDGLKSATLLIGHHSWIGRRSILNASADLTIGQRVCVGIGSRIFTHGCWWEAVEGYPSSYKPVTIRDDAWLALGVTVQPGADIEAHVFVNSGAVVTGRLSAHGTYAGVPAIRKGEWRPEDLSLREKYLIIFRRLNGLSATEHTFETGMPFDFMNGEREIQVVFWESRPPSLINGAINLVPAVGDPLAIKGQIAVIDMSKKVSYGDEQLAHPLINFLKDHTLRILPCKYADCG